MEVYKLEEQFKTMLEMIKERHKGQVDKAGKDYVLHPMSVALNMPDLTTMIIALGHDLLEDTATTKNELYTLFNVEIVEAIGVLTKPEGMEYFEYLDRVLENKLACTVKLGDLHHNCCISRLPFVTEKDKERVVKYKKAQQIILDKYPDLYELDFKAQEKHFKEVSKFISLVLRHKPETIGIALDKHGYASASELLCGLRKHGEKLSREQLELIVALDDKKRYSYNMTHTLIRANQGHSINVNLNLSPLTPPDVLLHGTGVKYLGGIIVQGIIAKSRQYVHLTDNYNVAKITGGRHGDSIVLEVDALQMYKDGFSFFQSENGVWLTNEVPAKYIINLQGQGTLCK